MPSETTKKSKKALVKLRKFLSDNHMGLNKTNLKRLNKKEVEELYKHISSDENFTEIKIQNG